MKRLLIALCLIAASSSAVADRGYNRYNYNRGYNNNWVVPAIIGGAVVGGLVYGLTAPAPVYVPPPVQYYPPPNPYAPPVYVVPPPVYSVPAPTLVWDGYCQCYR